MRLLSARQIRVCEESARPRCKCRCHGALHGIRQGEYRQVVLLPEDENAHLQREPVAILQAPPLVAHLDEP